VKTFARRLARLPHFVAARAVDAGLARGHTGYARFVVLGWYRTGSNLLVSLLNSDPGVVAYSELFSPRGVFWGNPVYAPSRDGRTSRDDAPRFLTDVVYRPYPQRVRAVGFKLFYPQLILRPVDGLLEGLSAGGDLRVVHLRRRNVFRSMVSNAVAKSTGAMASVSPEDAARAEAEAPPVRFTPEECETYFTQLDERAQRCEALFPAGSIVNVEYEDLVADRDAEVGRVRAFLGLAERPVSTRLVKQSRRPLRDAVANFDELAQHFTGTRWAEFFRDD
jgi:LPS sulfotransferase NodH